MGEGPFDRLVSPHGFDGTGPVPDEVTKALQRSAMLRVKFLTTESGLNTGEIDELFHALTLTAEWSREVTEVRDRDARNGGALIRGRLYDLVQTEDGYEAFCRVCDWHVLGVETLESADHLAVLHVGDEHFDV